MYNLFSSSSWWVVCFSWEITWGDSTTHSIVAHTIFHSGIVFEQLITFGLIRFFLLAFLQQRMCVIEGRGWHICFDWMGQQWKEMFDLFLFSTQMRLEKTAFSTARWYSNLISQDACKFFRVNSEWDVVVLNAVIYTIFVLILEWGFFAFLFLSWPGSREFDRTSQNMNICSYQLWRWSEKKNAWMSIKNCKRSIYNDKQQRTNWHQYDLFALLIIALLQALIGQICISIFGTHCKPVSTMILHILLA